MLQSRKVLDRNHLHVLHNLKEYYEGKKADSVTFILYKPSESEIERDISNDDGEKKIWWGRVRKWNGLWRRTIGIWSIGFYFG